MIKRLSGVTLLIVSFWGITLSASASADAGAIVTRFHDKLITMMKTEGYEARFVIMGLLLKNIFIAKLLPVLPWVATGGSCQMKTRTK
jgi:hypothetical protein